MTKLQPMKKLILLFLSLVIVSEAHAQNNVLNMNDECYRLYRQARELAGDETCLIYLDSLIQCGESLGDVKAVTLGHQQKMGYYVRTADEENMLKTAREARAIDLKYGSDTQYFMTYRVMVKYYLDHGRMLEALDIACEMRDDPHTFEVPFGEFSFNHTMAIICCERGMQLQAREFYSKAIDVALNNDLPIMASGDLFTRLSELYPAGSDSCKLILDKAESVMKVPVDTFYVYSSIALNSALRSDKAEYDRAIEIYENYFSHHNYKSRGNFDVKAQIAEAVSARKWKEALNLCDELKSKDYACRVRLAIADMSGDPGLSRKAAGMLIAYSDSLQDVLAAHDLEEMSLRFERSKAEKQALLEEKELENKTRSQRKIASIIAALLSLMLMILHMTRRSRRLKEQQRLNATLKQASDMKTNFVHNMSHEIRTPLNAILGFSQLLALPDDFVTPEERKQYGEYISNNGQMLLMLVNDILSLSDVEQGRINISVAPVNIHEVVENCINSVRDRVPDGVELFCTSDCPDPYVINTDALRVQQVLINYLTNACKNTTNGGIHVHSSLDEMPGYLSLSVTDTGCGVDPSKAETIFDRFTKLDEFKQGNGLGLNLCRQISENLGGKVFLDTTYTDGARFVFAIPTKP